jgi:hypothetical protein
MLPDDDCVDQALSGVGGNAAQDENLIHWPWNVVAVTNEAVHLIACGSVVGHWVVCPKPMLEKGHGLALVC